MSGDISILRLQIVSGRNRKNNFAFGRVLFFSFNLKYLVNVSQGYKAAYTVRSDSVEWNIRWDCFSWRVAFLFFGTWESCRSCPTTWGSCTSCNGWRSPCCSGASISSAALALDGRRRYGVAHLPGAPALTTPSPAPNLLPVPPPRTTLVESLSFLHIDLTCCTGWICISLLL